ncbi:TAP-like protein-domain-containing protein [Armillaria novae-zelandiae]|uniref:TAP-like protein-domain-containing protein n=1 Tax=Armillaria novae-zelandiae TaxID=153914 RepID=A0AA39ULJ3_9AGAR|nr:TAP-like protein-domain-containing protein [Armillaria novae-zelandiae]
MVSLFFTFCILFYREFLFPVVLAQSDFDWSNIEPTSNLSWVDCYSDYQCTRFQVPIDYSNEDGSQAALAVIKLPAQSETEYKGTVLINPGGPGGSGVSAMTSIGPLAVSILGNQYDIVSFDPRGVANSTPKAQFFLSKEEQYQWLASSNNWATVVNTTSDQIPHLWASAQVLAELALERDTGILNYISTDNVARDMLRISQAAGQEKLQYYGVSYGTLLGSTFAAMFPDKVERMVLDGVVDADAYYRDDWRNSTVDTDKVMQSFFDGCVAAGPDACAFYASTAEQISSNLDSLYDSLLIQPVPVVSPPFYGVIDYSLLRSTIWSALYAPYEVFSILAEGLASLRAGNGTIIYELQGGSYDPYSGYDNSLDAQIAISCGDAANNTDSVTDLFAYAHDIEALSNFSNLLPLMQRIRCSGWKFHRGDIFTGPITGNTSYPILFIGNTADPVTPLSAANKLSTAFPGSVVLTQNSSGHTSISASSECTDAYVQAYFQNGTLPKDGTVCEIESEMFPASSAAVGGQRRSFWRRK